MKIQLEESELYSIISTITTGPEGLTGNNINSIIERTIRIVNEKLGNELSPSELAAQKYYEEKMPVLAKPGGILLKQEQLKEYIINAFISGYNHK